MTKLPSRYTWPIGIAIAAVAVRWIFLFQLSGQPGFTVPMVDEQWHWEWALSIIHGSFFGEGPWFRAPLYPYFLALLAFVSGESVLWAKLLQVLLCGGTAFFLVRLGERLFSRSVGVIAGGMYVFYGTLIYYESAFLIPVLFLFLLVWGMYRLVALQGESGWNTWLATGAVFGLAAISRPNVLLVIPLLMLWVFWISPRRKSILERGRRPLLLLAGLVLVIAPVTLRNVFVVGDFILISSQGGVNLYLGNNPMANGLAMVMPEVELSEAMRWRDFEPATHAAAERLAGRELTQAEASDFWSGRTYDFILENPSKFGELLWKKSVYLASGFENSDNADIYYERGKSSLYALLLWEGPLRFPFGLLLPLALAGIVLRRKEAAKLAPLYLFILGYIPTIILFLVTARHRLPLVPFLMVIAAAGVVKGVELLRVKRYRAVAVGGAVLAVALLVFNQTYYEEGGQNEFQIHFNDGMRAEHLGQLAEAEKEYLAADREFRHSPALLANLGYVQYQLGKPQEAERSYYRALAVNPSFYRALNNLGLLVLAQGKPDSALALFTRARSTIDMDLPRGDELGQIYANIGQSLERLGEGDRAGAYFDSAVASAPQWQRGIMQAAAFHARQQNFEISDSLFYRGQLLGEPTASDFFNWGLSFIERKEFTDAVHMLRKAVRRDDFLYQGHYLIGVTNYQQGLPADSVIPHIDRALRINPQYAPAVQFRDQVLGGAGR